uniref:Mediator complex subunit 9 n=1 Tax=Syphacia muris TaxID=451379 RepID=A0A0N5AS24_9BILA
MWLYERCCRASRARSHRSAPSSNPADSSSGSGNAAATVASQPAPSLQKHPKYREASSIQFPDVATYESSCQDVAFIKGQLLELQRLVNVRNFSEASATDILPKKTPKDSDGLAVEDLLRENEALRKQLEEKDQIISMLRAQIPSV